MTAQNAVANALDSVADAAEVVVETNQDVADIIRDAPSRGFGLAFGALLLGAGIGGGVAYLFTRRYLETKYNDLAENEISDMRRHFQAKIKAAEQTATKLAPVKDIVTERGYAQPPIDGPPMAVQPPAKGVGDEEAEKPPEVVNVFHTYKTDEEDVWDEHDERRRRSPDAPYVIHYDERYDIQDYSDMSLTYYEGDDVLCNERDEVIAGDDRERQVGEANLSKFGHGSNDPAIVYVRNDALEIMYEIVRSPNSFAEEVHGFSHGAYDHGNLERMRARERDGDEEG